ncbi:hypothetical protein [Actinomadura miaoliensis]|uniref:Uncharacterized protein n=1 Tax=Actinomadura miaoliensis TaxID=430685 RepID=A0ABP7V321_9ACTN
MSVAQAITALEEAFPGWEVRLDGDRWVAERVPSGGVRLGALVVTAVSTPSARELRAALEVFTRTDAEILLRRLAEALRRRGHGGRVRGTTLTICDPHGGERVITCSDGKYRSDGGWPIGSVADLIDRKLINHGLGRSR